MPARIRSIYPILLIITLILSACAPKTAPAPTQAPTLPPTEAPAQPTAAPTAESEPEPTALPTEAAAVDADAYPYPAAMGQPTLPPSGAYPAPEGEGPSTVISRPNQSQVLASLIEISADPDNPDLTRLRALVEEVKVNQEAGGDYTSDLVDQEVDFYVKGIDIPDLQAGDLFSAEVTYNGDESGGRFFITAFIE